MVLYLTLIKSVILLLVVLDIVTLYDPFYSVLLYSVQLLLTTPHPLYKITHFCVLKWPIANLMWELNAVWPCGDILKCAWLSTENFLMLSFGRFVHLIQPAAVLAGLPMATRYMKHRSIVKITYWYLSISTWHKQENVVLLESCKICLGFSSWSKNNIEVPIFMWQHVFIADPSLHKDGVQNSAETWEFSSSTKLNPGSIFKRYKTVYLRSISFFAQTEGWTCRPSFLLSHTYRQLNTVLRPSWKFL